MLLSFSKLSISALTAPIYQSVEETLYEKTRKSNLNFVPSVNAGFIALFVYNTT